MTMHKTSDACRIVTSNCKYPTALRTLLNFWMQDGEPTSRGCQQTCYRTNARSTCCPEEQLLLLGLTSFRAKFALMNKSK